MAKEKFTPGPWFVDHGVPGKPRIFSRADNLIKSMVCACEHGALSRQEHDAALIAAADRAAADRILLSNREIELQKIINRG